jgi:hypothetical protein
MAPFSVTVHHGPYLHLVATGGARLSDLLGLVDLAARVVKVEGDRRVLADLISIHVLFSDDEFRQLQLHAAKTLQQLERLAYTVPACYNEGKGDPPTLPDGVAVRSFTKLQDACDWIGG